MLHRITSPTFDIEKQCGKCRHKTPSDALKHAQRFMDSFGEFLTPYLCGHCGFFHVGHKRFEDPKPVITDPKDLWLQQKRLEDQQKNIELNIIKELIKEPIIAKINSKSTEAVFLYQRTPTRAAWRVRHGSRYFVVMAYTEGCTGTLNTFDLMRIEDEYGNTIKRSKIHLGDFK